MISVKGLDVSFKTQVGEFKACSDINLEIEKGDIFGIVGYSGAGKSTLVRCLNLLQRPSEGQIYLDGLELTSLDDKQLRNIRRQIGMIFQSFNLMSSRTVYDNVYYPIRDLKLDKKTKIDRVKKLLQLVGISDKERLYPSQLSGGEKQRVAIARSLATNPKVLLCDEATSALDPKTTKSILELLRNVNEELGITIVIITHEMQVIKSICNKCAVMDQGKITEYGTVIDIFANPGEDLTKDFINTTTNKSETIERLKRNLQDKNNLFYLQFIGGNTHHAFMLEIYKRFKVGVNVLAGNVEYITNVPLGNIIVQLQGIDKSINLATEYLKEHNIKVEVL